MTEQELNAISGTIVDCAMKVHSALGPGLLESAYEACLIAELKARNRRVRSQVVLPVVYRDIVVHPGYRLDLLVEEEIIVELKSILKVHPIHEAKLQSHLRLSKKRLGLLINFNVVHLRDGITRRVNGL